MKSKGTSKAGTGLWDDPKCRGLRCTQAYTKRSECLVPFEIEIKIIIDPYRS